MTPRSIVFGMFLLCCFCNPSAEAQRTDSPPFVLLLEPGQEPRVPLRYRLSLDSERARFVLRMSLGMEAGANQIPDTPLPPVQTIVQLEKVDSEQEERTRFRFRFLEARALQESGIDSTLIAGLNRELQILQGLSGRIVVGSNGVFWDTSFDGPSPVNERIVQILRSIQQQIEQLSVPVPDEPVGIGARWQVTTPVRSGDLEVSQTTVYRLMQLSGVEGELMSSVFQQAGAKNSRIHSPRVPAFLESYEGSGFGRIEFHLERLVPRVVVSLNSEAIIWAEAGGASQKTKTRLGLQSTIEPAVMEPKKK